MNKMKNFKRRFSLSVPRTETIEENEFTEQINQLNIHCNDGVVPNSLGLHSLQPSPVAPDSQDQSPTELQYRKKVQHRRFSMEDVTKRMSLPMDIRLPPEFLKKLQMESPPPCKPLSRMSRRASLSDIGFGKLETYVKLGKLGEVRCFQFPGGVGCILYEMATGRSIFPGSTVKEELHLIFRLMGTPTEESWPRITANEEFKSYLFPQYRAQALINHVPRLDTEGIDLLTAFLLYDTKRRISAESSLRHSYFLTLGENIHSIPDTSSVFSLRELQLQKDPGHKSSVFQPPGRGKNRRQSIF
ncbi:cyclin-dependent kinase 18-like [Sinocyclocheilus rhinocerous]|uniref:cyclin-dependent kinase 18-like n=1 Tax=Sinocyclocheilus rhinocerous TaxID=307959 RepID=UPI0007B9B2E8|nr:PREDICTED: cyclin-dependent kinase 18-like [Sinocyclocheilus rhinocerous]